MPLAKASWRPLRRRLHAIIASCHKLIEAVWDPYRPELHYMRGRGPRWHARHRAS
ncbi:hypothetical protein ACVJGD_001137 [Bradyrhizobium sp. USDA 10063]